MKSILFAVLFLFVPKLCISQVIITATANDYAVYLDSLFNIGSEKNYKYIRIIKDYENKNLDSYEVTDYYKSGKIAMSGFSTTRDITIAKTGTFIYYYENGNKKSITNYKLDKMNGKSFDFYENGNKKQEVEYYITDDTNGKSEYKVNQFWDKNGVQKVTDGNGVYEEIDERSYAIGNVKDGFKDNYWGGFDKILGYAYFESYKDQKLISGSSAIAKISHIYTVVEKHPEYEKGMKAFYKYVGKNFRVPDLPLGVEGKIYIKFFVDVEGNVIYPKIIKGIGYGADEEAIRVLKKSGKWIPGEIRGIKVLSAFTLPIVVHN